MLENHGYFLLFFKEALKKGVRLNCICPSCVETDMLSVVTRNPALKQAVDLMGVQT